MTTLKDIKAKLEMAIKCVEKEFTDEALLHANMALVDVERMMAAEVDREAREFVLQNFDKLVVYITRKDVNDQSYSVEYSKLLHIIGGSVSDADDLIREMVMKKMRQDAMMRIHHHEMKNSR